MNIAEVRIKQPAARADVQADAKVWDIPLRIFHCSLVAAVAAALVTGLVLPPTWITLHLVAGTTAAALVAVRVVWGLWGPGAARFASFVHGPRTLLIHCRELADGTARPHLGHNPLGSAMIFALLVAVILLALTGVVAQGGVLKMGSLAFMTTYDAGWAVRQVHKIISYILLGSVALHIAGVLFESRRSRENLIRAMFDGRKAARPGDIAPPPIVARPVLSAVVATLLLLAGAGTVDTLARLPGLGVPRTPLDPVYADECGACHIPFHPSLAPAAAWTAIMADLSHHFGDNAELDAATAERLRKYLLANSAEHYDTLAAHRLRQIDPADPLRITATPFWQRAHRRIPASVFASKQVVARSNCSACHQDTASGLFEPSAIQIPENAEP